MPHVVNGIGTWYAGKREQHTRVDICASCGKVSRLSSYDTTLCFVIFFVPLIPLRRCRVTDDCSLCRHHYSSKLSDFRAMRDTAIAAARENLSRPDDPEEARSSIDFAARVGGPGFLREFGSRITVTYAENASLLADLARAYESLGLTYEAEDAYQLAVHAGADDRALDDHARLLMRLGRPEEAWDQIQAVLESEDLNRRGVVSLAIRAFQAAGNHAAALEILDSVDGLGREWQRAIDASGYRRISEGDGGKGRKIRSNLWDYGTAPPASRWPSWLRGSVTVPVLAALLIAVFCIASWQVGRSRTIFIVNGLGSPYSIQVNGEPCGVSPHSWRSVNVNEGDVLIGDSSHPDVPGGERVSIRTNFWTRLFDRKTYVVNPDRCAILTVEDVVYTPPDRPPSNRPTPPRLSMRKLLHEFESIEDAFTAPPRTVSVDAGSSSVHRDVLAIADVADWYREVLSALGEVETRSLLATLLRSQTRDEYLLDLCASAYPAQEFCELLAPLLAERPLNAAAHRHWQIASLVVDPHADLSAHYRALLAEAPDNPDAKYLLAMVSSSVSETKLLLEPAPGSAPPNPAATLALAELHASLGEWQDALRVSATDPLSCEPVTVAAYFATGEFQNAINTNRHTGSSLDYTIDDAIEHAQLLVLLGRKDEVARFASETRRAWNEAGASPEVCDGMARAVHAQIALDSGDTEEFLRLSEKTGSAWHSLQRPLLTRDWPRALEAARELDDDRDYLAHMALYIAATRAGESEVAIECFERLVRALSAGDSADHTLRDWLMGSECTAEALANFAPSYQRTSLMLATLVTRRPDLLPVCSARGLATAWNPRFPHSLAREVLRTPEPAAKPR